MQLKILRRLCNLDEHPICKCDNKPQLVTLVQTNLKWKGHKSFWHGHVYRLLLSNIFKTKKTSAIAITLPNANVYKAENLIE
jgi:hypothetical protein